jgi:Ca2+-binding EF-hand superfamily protein
MASFFRKFLKNPQPLIQPQQDEVVNTVNRIWFRYDSDRSGYLDKRETLRFLNDFLADRGKRPVSVPLFNRFFDEVDVNGDNVLSKNEMARFVKRFLEDDKQALIEETVKKIFLKYDTNRSGFLEKRETLQLLDEVLAEQAQPRTSIS